MSRYGEEIARLRAAGSLIDRVLEAAGKLKMGPAIITKIDQVSCFGDKDRLCNPSLWSRRRRGSSTHWSLLYNLVVAWGWSLVTAVKLYRCACGW